VSDALCDIEAKLLAGRLTQRARLLAIATGKEERGAWLRTGLVGTMIAAAAFFCVSTTESSTVMGFAGMLSLFACLMSLQVEYFAKRVDALIELLQQDGQLQGTPPPLTNSSSKSPVRPSNPNGGLSTAHSQDVK
jgi:hypothetical protein